MPRLKSFLLMSFFVVSGVAAVATHVWRQRIEAEFDPKPIYGVIFAQFEACRSDDFGKAYGQASRGVQEHFTLIQYVSKIRTEYGRISQPQKLQFGSDLPGVSSSDGGGLFLERPWPGHARPFHHDPGERPLANRKFRGFRDLAESVRRDLAGIAACKLLQFELEIVARQ